MQATDLAGGDRVGARLSASIFEPITVGFGGVFYTSAAPPGAQDADLKWLDTAFARTPAIRRTVWRSAEMLAVSHEHVAEAGGEPGQRSCPVPSVSACQGLAVGQAVGRVTNDDGIQRASDAFLRQFCDRGLGGLGEGNGVWAAVAWDDARRRACFVRDALGAQSLYAGRAGECFVFGTDLRVFLASGRFDGLNDQAVAEFLRYFYVAAPITLLPEVHAVLPGHGLWSDGWRQERYAPSRFQVSAPTLSPGEVDDAVRREVPRFRDHLHQAVADRVPATGRIALALSGGKDSSALAIALSQTCPDRVLAFSVGAVNPRFNEAPDAALVCEALGLEFKAFVPTDAEIAEGIEQFAAISDQPTGDLAAFSYFLAMKSLPRDCTVVFDGTGSDYYFGLPTPAKGQHIFRRRHQLQQLIPDVAWPAVLGLMSWGPSGMRALRRHWARPIEESFLPWHGWSEDEIRAYCGRDVSFESTFLWQVMRSRPPKEWVALLTEFLCIAQDPNTSYRKARVSAHGLGLGIRFPFNDSRLSDYVKQLPVELKYSQGPGGKNKVLLRAYLATSLPAAILNKPKSGFVPELNRMLVNSRYAWLADLERHGLLQVLGGSDEPVRRVLERYAQAPDDPRWQHRLYALAVLASVVAVRKGWRPVLA